MDLDDGFALGPGEVASAYASSETAQEALTAGAWQILSKPVDFPKLLKLVDEALGQPFVLVVEGDHDLCANLWDLLRERAYRFCLAYDEHDAAKHLKDSAFQLVLIDMKLPKGTLPPVREVREELAEVAHKAYVDVHEEGTEAAAECAQISRTFSLLSPASAGKIKGLYYHCGPRADAVPFPSARHGRSQQGE